MDFRSFGRFLSSFDDLMHVRPGLAFGPFQVSGDMPRGSMGLVYLPTFSC